MDKFPAPRGSEKPPAQGQRSLHTKQSLPNLWLPPRYGPIPAHLSRAQQTPPQPSSPNPPPQARTLAPPRQAAKPVSDSEAEDKDKGKGREKPRTPLLTPPLTPSSSVVGRRAGGSMRSDGSGSVEEVTQGVEGLAVEEERSRFLLISSVPARLSPDILQTLFAPYSGEVKGMYVRLQESHGVVVLAFWDEAEAARVRREVDGAGIVGEAESGQVRLAKGGERERIGAKFVGAEELRALIGHSMFIDEVETLGEVCVGLTGAALREGEVGALRALFEGIGRVRGWEVCGEIVRVEYSDIRDAASALELDGRTMFGATLRVFRRERDGERGDDGTPVPSAIMQRRGSKDAGFPPGIMDRRGSRDAGLFPNMERRGSRDAGLSPNMERRGSRDAGLMPNLERRGSRDVPPSPNMRDTNNNLSASPSVRAVRFGGEDEDVGPIGHAILKSPAGGGRARSVSADRRKEAAVSVDGFGRRGSNYHLYDAVGKVGNGVEQGDRRGSVQEERVGAEEYSSAGPVYDFGRAAQAQYGGEPLYESAASAGYAAAAAYGQAQGEGWEGYYTGVAMPEQQHQATWNDAGYYYATPVQRKLVSPQPHAFGGYHIAPHALHPHQQELELLKQQQEYLEYMSAYGMGYAMHGHAEGMAGAGVGGGVNAGYLGYEHQVSPVALSPAYLTPVSPYAAAGPARDVRPEHNQVNLARIEDGMDTRTTVMIKNIPNKMSDRDLLEFIGRVTPRRIDFLYLRMDFQNGCNVGYAFVNFITVQDLLLFAKAKLGVKWNMYSSEKVLQMSYANYQGKEALVEKFKNSCIMDEREEWRPKIFYSDGPNQGLPEPFPKPTHLRRKERSSHNRGALYVPGLHHHHHQEEGRGVRLEDRRRAEGSYQPPFKRGRAPHM